MAALSLSLRTVYRLLDRLLQSGFVRRNEATEKYAIGLQAGPLGLAAVQSFDLTDVAPPVRNHFGAAVAARSAEGAAARVLSREGQVGRRFSAIALDSSHVSGYPPDRALAFLAGD